ncbi:MAG TPA: GAF domain-containing protein [Candidatus Dormibacteraeota bacterium]
MGQLPDLQEARRRLGLALDAISHDRWVLGYLRGGALQPIAASEITARFLQSRPLMPLSRRAIYERRPVVVNSVAENPSPTSGYDWELDWPAVLYAPVGELGQRPIGLLTVGCRRDHWYTEADIHYAVSLGITLAPMVEALRRPLSRLNETENEVAQLLSYGLSEPEIARAIKVPERRARSIVEDVVRKLSVVSLEVALAFQEAPARRRELRL